MQTKQFYTNIQVSRNNILVRGYRDGEPFDERVPYQPYYFVKSKNNKPTEFKNLKGEYLARLDFDSLNDAREFVTKYDGMGDSFPIFGYNRPLYNYISDNFAEQEPVLDAVSIVYLDIEVAGNHYEPVHRVQLENDTATTIGELRFYPGIKVWDENRSAFVDQDKSSYLKPNGAAALDTVGTPNPITAISLRKDEQIWVLSTVEYEEHRDDVIHIRCNDEKQLLVKFIELWKKLKPEVMSGWNIELYDIPYIINRLTKVFGIQAAKQISPWGLLRETVIKTKYGKEQQSYKILGIAIIDMMTAYIKFSFKNHESFTLNYIAHIELGEKKIDYSEYESLYRLYLENPQLFIEYNIQDTDLVYKINEKTGLIPQIMELAYSAGVNYEDAFTSVLFWEVKIKNWLAKKGIIVPANKPHVAKPRKNAGAYVKPPIPAKYKWVIGLDLDSLYPHLIMQYNISPETLVSCHEELLHLMTIDDILDGKLLNNQLIRENIQVNKYGFTPNGCFFRNDIQGFLAAMMREEYDLRKHYKKLMIKAKIENEETPSNELEKLISKYNNMQLARKIAINAAYGAAANEWFIFYSMELAEAITYAGQLVIKFIGRKLNTYLNKLFKTNNVDYIIAQDTDSCYLTFDRLVELIMPGETDTKKIVDFLVKVTQEKINPFINKCYEELRSYTNAYEQKMSMKTESISEYGIWKAKKRYALNVWWDEGVTYHEPKLKIRGIEAVSSTIPAVCRDGIKKCLTLMLTDKKEELYAYTKEFEKQFRAFPFEQIAKTSGIKSEIHQYMSNGPTLYRKGTPMHVRAAILYNHYIRKLKIDDTYLSIAMGDKMKYCYLKMPNPIKEDVIGIYNKLPSEFNIQKYIDYDTQFNKVFVEPVNSIANIIGWDIKNKESIYDFLE